MPQPEVSVKTLSKSRSTGSIPDLRHQRSPSATRGEPVKALSPQYYTPTYVGSIREGYVRYAFYTGVSVFPTWCRSSVLDQAPPRGARRLCLPREAYPVAERFPQSVAYRRRASPAGVPRIDIPLRHCRTAGGKVTPILPYRPSGDIIPNSAALADRMATPISPSIRRFDFRSTKPRPFGPLANPLGGADRTTSR